ncbi:bifunctional serine/threonine-protein kinase/ABC transporter substrate-binding protein [Streptomyces sp. Caat 7-52]|uniref:bifunctional serine/threonine-protein kinase/ABC transporter substrate-binding protein n=1 Tax=Streptomyces sp. Caat 7-52 TaxID=2949637 RepID=UPI002035B699|nr:bifunctional serine/threonine-protein kinase/ABC transporter substrate-binding protein [Streptomyces sp. Caat 7-52]
MEPLRTSDPSRLAGRRLLGRLGAGGMGVVYLARSADGSLVALKVIQAEYAEDAGFRERFRREAQTARRMTSPWVASLVDADPDAAQPWLATAFVPGPSLGEAVAAHGPLPVRGLRVLGTRLAQALGELHGVGLVHRDVKPGNVLLALDGPRLIDFGVARDPRDTALTSTGVVVGTPGFLPPEQARGTGESAAPGDIFSLGCVLAFAATGRPPFGTGSLDALLYRTVHDAPDLEGVPRPLAEVVRGCLEKDPRLRPTAQALSETLTVTASETPPDPREALLAVRPATPRDTDAPDAVAGSEAGQAADERFPADEAWLPEPLVRLIAERSAAGLALPAVDVTEVDPASAGTAPSDTAAAQPAARAVGRRRFLLLTGGAAVVAAGGGLAAWAGLDGNGGGEDDAAPTATGPVYTLGLHADLTGDQKAVGRAQDRGLRLAVHEFNSRADRPFTLAVKTVDDGGDPTRAPKAAKELVADPSVLAVIGPTTDAGALASLAAYDAASLPLIAVTPGATALQVMGSRSFLHARVTDTLLPFYLDVYLRGTAKSRTVGIVDDRAADAYAWEISSTLATLLRKVPLPAVPKVVSALRTDFGPTLDALLEGGADSVVFAGYHDRAALLARELTSRDFAGVRAAAQGVLDARFLSAAGDAAEGWVIVAPAMDATVVPAAKAFRAAHRKLFGAEPERYAVETYDVAQFAVKTLRSLSAGRRTRQTLTTALRSGSHKGIARNLAFSKETGALVPDGSGVHLWKVEGGKFAYQGPAPYQVAG